MASEGFWTKSNKLMVLGISVVIIGVSATVLHFGFTGNCTEGEPCKFTFSSGDSLTLAWKFAEVSQTTIVSGSVPTILVPVPTSSTVSPTE